MKFTFTERDGDTPIEEWLVEKVKEYARRTYGIEIEIFIQSGEEDQGGGPENAPFHKNKMRSLRKGQY